MFFQVLIDQFVICFKNFYASRGSYGSLCDLVSKISVFLQVLIDPFVIWFEKFLCFSGFLWIHLSFGFKNFYASPNSH